MFKKTASLVITVLLGGCVAADLPEEQTGPGGKGEGPGGVVVGRRERKLYRGEHEGEVVAQTQQVYVMNNHTEDSITIRSYTIVTEGQLEEHDILGPITPNAVVGPNSVHQINWDQKDQDGNLVPIGPYAIKLKIEIGGKETDFVIQDISIAPLPRMRFVPETQEFVEGEAIRLSLTNQDKTTLSLMDRMLEISSADGEMAFSGPPVNVVLDPEQTWSHTWEGDPIPPGKYVAHLFHAFFGDHYDSTPFTVGAASPEPEDDY